MGSLRFRGEVPGSKSVFNRALIVQSYYPDFQIFGQSQCDDVRFMTSGLKEFFSLQDIDCGEGGTTFRFLSLRVSRTPGTFLLKGTPRLLQRPSRGLQDLLQQLGVSSQFESTGLRVVSSGWKKPSELLRVDTSESSQYASALILNAWNLDFDLEFELVGSKVSESYFVMTVEFLRLLGMDIQQSGSVFKIPSGQKIKVKSWKVEADVSSAFAVAAAAVLSGDMEITNFPFGTHQPDLAFLDFFKEMGIPWSSESSRLRVPMMSQWQGLEANLFQCPDLFPVLAVLCGLGQGTSRLFGAPQLKAKESDRIAKVSDLLSQAGIKHESHFDGMTIWGQGSKDFLNQSPTIFDPDHDHRMVMAASLLKMCGLNIQITDPHCINKSFPEFWETVGVTP